MFLRSVVRRVALGRLLCQIDGQIETPFLTVLDEFGAYPLVIGREVGSLSPFLATTKVWRPMRTEDGVASPRG